MSGIPFSLRFGRWMIFAAFVFGISVSSALASTCIKLDVPLSDRIRSEVKSADAIFLGTVERFDFVSGLSNEFLEKRRAFIPDFTWETKTTVFSVDSYWKGIDATEISIVSDETRNSDGTRSSSSDEYQFEKGKTYLVFAWKLNGYLKTSDCSFTRRDPRFLGQ